MRYSLFIFILSLTACSNGPENIALGTLERDRIAHTATANEVVVALPVPQGSIVQKGTVLVKLDDTLQTAQVRKAEAGVAQAEAHLDKLRSGARVEEVAAARAKVAGAKATMIESETSHDRSQNLIKQKVISVAILDKSLATRDASRASLQNAEEQLHKILSGTREEDLRAAEAQLGATVARPLP